MANDLKNENEIYKNMRLTQIKICIVPKKVKISSQRTQATIALKSALEAGDHDKAAKAQDILLRLQLKKIMLASKSTVFISKSQKAQNNEVNVAQPVQQPQIIEPSDKIHKLGLKKKTWFGKDETNDSSYFCNTSRFS